VHSRMDFRDFSKWRKENPKASPKVYAKDRGISIEEAEFRARNWQMEAGSLYNMLPALSEKRRNSFGKPQNDEDIFSELLAGSSHMAAQPPLSSDPEQQAFLGEVRSALRASLCMLTDLHIKVVMMCHGLGKYKNPHTYPEVANLLGCKKQNVHQIYSLAMKKLAANPLLAEIWKEVRE
jgi:DNA-directed RNA polymerase sigma subunit (sigma70/sigma32)